MECDETEGDARGNEPHERPAHVSCCEILPEPPFALVLYLAPDDIIPVRHTSSPQALR